MSITLNDQYATLRSSAFDLNRVATAKGKRIAQLASGTSAEDPASSGVDAGSVLKLRNSGLRLRALETGVINAISFLETQSEMFQQMTSVVSRMSHLAVMMRDTLKNDEEVQNHFEEVSELMEELSSYRTAQFNGRDLINHVYGTQQYLSDPADPSSVTTASTSDLVSSVDSLSVAVTEDGGKSVAITLADSSTFNETLEYLLGKINTATTPRGDGQQISSVDEFLDEAMGWGQKGFDNLNNVLAQRIATNQREQSALRLNLDRIRERMLGIEAATSRVADVDVAQELSALARSDMQFRGAIATKTQSNVLADSALMILSNQAFSSPLIRESRLATPSAG